MTTTTVTMPVMSVSSLERTKYVNIFYLQLNGYDQAPTVGRMADQYRMGEFFHMNEVKSRLSAMTKLDIFQITSCQYFPAGKF